MNEETRPLQIAAVLGSLRTPSFSRMALEAALESITSRERVRVDLIDPRALVLGLPGTPENAALEAALAPRIKRADGLILATPEYHGSYSSVMKALIDGMGYPSALADKPVALIGVAAGRLGAVKALEHLRSVCAHVGALVLPYPVSIAEAHTVFTPDGRCVQEELCAQLAAVGDQLVDYLEGHYHLRESVEEMVREHHG